MGGGRGEVGPLDGHFGLFMDNLVTSGGAKQVAAYGGALTWAVSAYGNETSLVDNIVAHLADPNNDQEFAEKVSSAAAAIQSHNGENIYTDDTIVYNWFGSNEDPNKLRAPDQNIDGLDPTDLNETTIQLFTATLLPQDTATIDDLGEYLRAQMTGEIEGSVDADTIIAYFQNGFGIAEESRTAATTLRFVPDDRGDGIRWDNRLNWDTEDLPGSVDGDSVNFAGNWVNYGTLTTTVSGLDLGSGGKLNVTSGYLKVDGPTEVGANGGEIDVSYAGQLWLDGYADTDELDVDVDGGRFANTGLFEGLLDMHITDGQALLGVDDSAMGLGEGSVLTVEGGEAKVGFDGEAGGTSTLRMEYGSKLAMVADDTGFSTIEEFRSGHFDTANDEPDVLSAFDMGGGTLLIDITNLADKGPQEHVLVDTDQIEGMFDDVELIGLGLQQDATLTVDYDSDKITLSLSALDAGSGQINIQPVGNIMNTMDNDEIVETLSMDQGTLEEASQTATEEAAASESQTEEELLPA
jgi:hypothetical protein